jgi:ferredoxin
MDVCLLFRKDFPPTGSGFKEITWAGVEAILREAEGKHLVTRPFRNQDDQSMVDGICFCCDDCCAYFLSPAEKCDKGKYVESTDLSACSECGLCEEVCYFEARKLGDQELRVERSRCYGCGLCVDVCPEGCIKMVSRV